MKKALAIFLCVVMTVSFFGCGKEKEYSDITFEVLNATKGAGSGEEAENLFDGNSDTKWCVVNFDGAEVVFEASEEVKINGYSFVTGNDCATFKGRNPRAWVISGSDNNEDWDVITEEEGNFDLPDANGVRRDFELTDVKDEYKYFKLEVVDVQSGNCMQISEFTLHYNGMDYDKLSDGKEEDRSSKNTNNENVYDYDNDNDEDDEINKTQKVVSASPKNYGKQTIVDGATYNFIIGDEITFVIPDTSDYYYYYTSWWGTSSVGIVDGKEECKVTAKREGEAQVGVSVGGKKDGNIETHQYKVTIKIVDPSPSTSQDSNNSGGSSGSGGGSDFNNDYTYAKLDCIACKGSGRCQTCGGDGYLWSSAADKENRICYSCHTNRGKCSTCRGSGKR